MKIFVLLNILFMVIIAVTATTTTPSTTTSTCIDKFNDCQRYSNAKRQYCNDLTYAGQPWMVENCAKFCGVCSDSGLVTTLPPCFDLFDDCQRYSSAKDTYCYDTTYVGQPWMAKNCAKYCGFCSNPTFAPTLPPTTPDEVLCPNP